MRQCKAYVHDSEAGVLQENDARKYVFTYANNGICETDTCTYKLRKSGRNNLVWMSLM